MEDSKRINSVQINSPIMKQTTLNTFFSPPTNRLKSYKIDHGSWLNKTVCNPHFKEFSSQLRKKNISKKTRKSSTKTSSKVSKYFNVLQPASPTDRMGSSAESNINTKKPLLLPRSESFETYGMVLPTTDKIIDNINKVRKEAEALDEYERLYIEESTTEAQNNLPVVNTSPIKEDLLDCKHLSLKELKMYFNRNLAYIRDIKNGVEYSVRHEMYQNYASKDKLTYNTSTVVFSSGQIEYLLNKLEINFDPDSENTEYIMMVLLPEICLRIFMDTHSMSLKEAVNYLDWRPVD